MLVVVVRQQQHRGSSSAVAFGFGAHLHITNSYLRTNLVEKPFCFFTLPHFLQDHFHSLRYHTLVTLATHAAIDTIVDMQLIEPS
jgi:hypothetical protein